MQFLERNYGDKNANLIEDFMVIGLDQESELKYLERQHQNESPDQVLAPSSVLYMHSNKTDCQRRSVIKEFCFPTGNGNDSKSLVLEKLQGQQEKHEVLYGQKDQTRKNIFVFTMQADDMSDKDYQHENVYFCMCMVVHHVVKLNKRPSQLRATGRPKKLGQTNKLDESTFDFYKCPKAYVLMSRHPFFNLYIDLLGQILQIYKLQQLELSKFKALQNTGSGPESIDLTFSFQANNDLLSSCETPDIIPQVIQFINILQDIKFDWIIEQNSQDPKVEIDYSPSHFQCRIPTSQ
jgi:hypothetical protein